VKSGLVTFEIYEQTDKHTDTLITILDTPSLRRSSCSSLCERVLNVCGLDALTKTCEIELDKLDTGADPKGGPRGHGPPNHG